jgi:subtilisin family serine protease
MLAWLRRDFSPINRKRGMKVGWRLSLKLRSGGAIATGLLATIAFAASGASASEDDGTRDATPRVAPAHRLIVEWAGGASSGERRAAREDAAVEYSRDLGSRRFQLVEPDPGQTVAEAIDALEADPTVIVAERDGYLTPDAIPNDPLFGQLWGLRNAGLGVDGFAGALAGADIDASGAWDRIVGTPATIVAHIDSGYRFEHPDLANVAWTNPGETPNGIDDDGDGIVDDLHGADFVGADATAPVIDGDPTDDDLEYGGHGVHTAGTIGAEGDNGIGITGVAQDVSIMPLRVCSWVPGEGACPNSAIVEAINYAGSHGARAANISLGEDERNSGEELIRDAIAANPQTLFVISAGNNGVSNEVKPHFPCVFDPLAEGKGAIDNIVCVAATDQADRLASFSNWGPKTVDLGAPGTEILSTYPITDRIDQDFEAADFDSKWTAVGPDGGFARTNESPLSSLGMSDSPGAAPVAGSARSSRYSTTLPSGLRDCAVEFTRTVSGGTLWTEVDLDGETYLGVAGVRSGRFVSGFGDSLEGGGDLDLTFRYEAGADPGPDDGVWIDDVDLHCTARLGEAGGYAFLQGTSMATPHVTGAAALLFSIKPSASVTEVRQALLGSVDHLPSLAGKTTSGGRLDISAAVDLFDAVSPPAPALAAANPASPSAASQLRLLGSSQPGTTVDVYAGPGCSGAPIAAGTSDELAGQGIAVTAATEGITEFSARATDLAPLTSICSAPIAYRRQGQEKSGPPPGEVERPPADSGGEASSPVAPSSGTASPSRSPGAKPACVVPKLAGRTLARAKRALTAAHCKLDTVRRRRGHRGHGAMVVKSSKPRPGARPTDGKVDVVLVKR